jgi:hypothetical protein
VSAPQVRMHVEKPGPRRRRVPFAGSASPRRLFSFSQNDLYRMRCRAGDSPFAPFSGLGAKQAQSPKPDSRQERPSPAINLISPAEAGMGAKHSVTISSARIFAT